MLILVLRRPIHAQLTSNLKVIIRKTILTVITEIKGAGICTKFFEICIFFRTKTRHFSQRQFASNSNKHKTHTHTHANTKSQKFVYF